MTTGFKPAHVESDLAQDNAGCQLADAGDFG
jgi:hypothetical protein